jgi:hypothetical protein
MPLLFASFRSLRQAQQPSLSGQKNKIQNFGNVQNFGFSFFLTIPINPKKRSIPPVCINERQGKNQMADFGNVQNQPFAFFPCHHTLVLASSGATIILPVDMTRRGYVNIFSAYPSSSRQR